MQLTDNKYITKDVAEILGADDWTISLLAKASVDRLIKYRGIGKVTAQRIINEAKVIKSKATIVETKEFTRVADLIMALESHGWTLSRIATTSPDKLLEFCSEDMARTAIAVVGHQVNEKRLAESQVLTLSMLSMAVPAVHAEEEPAVSVRVRRIRGSQKE